MEPTTRIVEWFIEENHPSTNGHFVNDPIIPGSVILELVRLSMKKIYPNMKLRCVDKMKITKSLRPGDKLIVYLEQNAQGHCKVACQNGHGESIASGSLTLSALEDSREVETHYAN